ncbi:MAG: glycosyltransferase [Saccharospirillum sp.]|nr:glycosyltransferase [Saccharospirillum sp.]
MNIVFFINSLRGGGAERVTTILANELSERGHSVKIVTRYSDVQDFYLLDSRVGRLIVEYDLNKNIFKRIVSKLSSIFKLRRLLKKNDVDVVVSMMTNASIFAILSTIKMNTRVVVAERNYPGLQSTPIILSYLRKYLFYFSDCCVVQTFGVEEWINKNVKTRDIKVIRNPVEFPLINNKPYVNPRDYIEFTDNKKIILSVGSKFVQKGFDVLLSAAIEGFKNNSFSKDSVYFVIAGLDLSVESDYGYFFLNEIKKQGLEDNFIFPGRVGNLSDWYSCASAFVLSSRYEGFPNVLIEAMSYNLPVVSTDCLTGPSEIIVDNKNGLLVEPENSDALLAGIKYILENDLSDRYFYNDLTLKNLDKKKVVTEWEDLFRELTN